MKNSPRSHCPINFALEIFGDRWSLLIIRDLMFKGKKHYREFLRSEEKIATNILADRLTKLEANGIISKEGDTANRSRLIYRLTEKGLDLIPVLTDIIVWSAKYDPKTEAHRDFVEKALHSRDELLQEVRDSHTDSLAQEAG